MFVVLGWASACSGPYIATVWTVTVNDSETVTVSYGTLGGACAARWWDTKSFRFNGGRPLKIRITSDAGFDMTHTYPPQYGENCGTPTTGFDWCTCIPDVITCHKDGHVTMDSYDYS